MKDYLYLSEPMNEVNCVLCELYLKKAVILREKNPMNPSLHFTLSWASALYHSAA